MLVKIPPPTFRPEDIVKFQIRSGVYVGEVLDTVTITPGAPGRDLYLGCPGGRETDSQGNRAGHPLFLVGLIPTLVSLSGDKPASFYTSMY